jgi:serine phosphatase RsbU (regulator of sigma subunit)
VVAPALLPADEAERIAAVRRYEILDTPPDGSFDRIARLAADLFDVPIGIVSIVDTDRIWFKAHHGVDVVQIDRDPGLCASAILGDEPWIISDARNDPRALANPLVAGEFGLQFYAGVPLTTHDGFNLGTLCVLGREPREVSDEQRRVLAELAALVVHELELRLSARQAVAAADRRLREAEQLAQALQSSLLPPALPAVPLVRLAAQYHPASRMLVGGDFYDVFPIRDGCWGFAIGDVCGTGPEAAAVTGLARHALRLLAREGFSGPSVLERLNAAILDEGARSRFLTLLYGELWPQPDGGAVLKVVCAGHPLPLRLRQDGTVRPAAEPQPLLGVMDDLELFEQTVELDPGDVLLCVTDGVTERREGSRMLGDDGLADVLSTCTGLTAGAVAARIQRAVERFASDAPSDDMAILTMRVPEPELAEQ